MTWQPGLPIRTEQDRLEWDTWRRDRILTAQRHRRAKLRRLCRCITGSGTNNRSIAHAAVRRRYKLDPEHDRHPMGRSRMGVSIHGLSRRVQSLLREALLRLSGDNASPAIYRLRPLLIGLRAAVKFPRLAGIA
jgi:hypothetical protein